MNEPFQPSIAGPVQPWMQGQGGSVGFDRHRAELQRARSALVEAELADRPSERFLAAQLAALRVAALVLALRSRPAGDLGPTARAILKDSPAGGSGSRRTSQPRNAWQLLSEVAPEYGEWAAFFAASQGKREAVRAGAANIVTMREADDLIRDAGEFLSLVERRLDRQRRHQEHPEGSSSGEPSGRGTPGHVRQRHG